MHTKPFPTTTGARRAAPKRLAAIGWVAIAASAAAQDWSNAGGNAQRSGVQPLTSPNAPADEIWFGGRPSIIAWQPVTEGDRLFIVRQTGFPPEPNSDESPVVAMDLDTGQELWFRNIPAAAGDWTTWIAGARDGRVYVSRSGNGASVSAVMYALDAATGATLWTSQATTSAGAYDGVVFAENGDLIVGDFRNVTRIRAVDGTTAWRIDRTCSVSSSCGACRSGQAVYIVDTVAGGQRVERMNADTGALEYFSPTMSGFSAQNTPYAGPGGMVFYSRSQNNAATDFLYAFHDDGAAIALAWDEPARWTTFSEYAATDGALYMIAPGNLVKKLDPLTGATLAEAEAPIAADVNLTARMAVDGWGRLYLTNGASGQGRLYAFDSDLTPRWDLPAANVNIGGPILARGGTLVFATPSTIRALRNDCIADLDGSGAVDLADLATLIARFGQSGGMTLSDGDINADGAVDLADLAILLANFGTAC